MQEGNTTSIETSRLSINKIRKILWKRYSHLSDSEISQMREDMINFWISIIED